MPKIELFRGLEATIPTLDEAVPAFTEDTKTLFIGSDSGNIKFSSRDDLLAELASVNVNAEVLAARGTYPTLAPRLDNVDNSLEDNAKHRINVKTLGLLADTGLDISNTLQSIITSNVLSSNRFFLDAGRYMISEPIMLKSNLDLLLDPNAEIYLMDNSKCRMFDTLTTGSYTNITIKGGIFNGNDSGQGATTSTGNFDFTNSMRFFNVSHLKVTDVLVRAVRGHGIEHWNCDQVTFKNIEFDQSYDLTNFPNGGSRRDGITGGSTNMKFINIHGFTDDDMIALLSGVSWGGVYVNEVKNVEVNGIMGISKSGVKTYRGIRIACADGKYTHNVKVTDISGSFNNQPILLGGYDVYIGGFLDDINLSNIHDLDFVGQFDEQGLIYHEKATCKNITIDGVIINGSGQYKMTLFQNQNAKINLMNLRNVNFNYTTSPTPASTGVLIKDRWSDQTYTSVFIDKINFYNVDYQDNSNLTLYRKDPTTFTVDNTYPLTHLRGSYISRKTYDVIDGGAKTKIQVDSEFINTALTNLLNQNTGYRNAWNNTIFTYLNNGFIPLSYNQTSITSGSYSFSPQENYLFIDATSATSYWRIQDNTGYKFPTGYTLTIKRTDSNATYTPYVRMTNDVTVDGNVQTNIAVNSTLKIQYDGNTWRTVS